MSHACRSFRGSYDPGNIIVGRLIFKFWLLLGYSLTKLRTIFEITKDSGRKK